MILAVLAVPSASDRANAPAVSGSFSAKAAASSTR